MPSTPQEPRKSAAVFAEPPVGNSNTMSASPPAVVGPSDGLGAQGGSSAGELVDFIPDREEATG